MGITLWHSSYLARQPGATFISALALTFFWFWNVPQKAGESGGTSFGIFDAYTVFLDRCHLADHIVQEIERQKRAGLIEERQLHGVKYWRIKHEGLPH